jgi:hypothetical protein
MAVVTKTISAPTNVPAALGTTWHTRMMARNVCATKVLIAINRLSYSETPANSEPQAESWVEISSQPSSSSLSSIDNEVITTGLRVQAPNVRRSRRHPAASASRVSQVARHRSTSSQDEYDESESSSDDRLLTSSNENIPSSGRISPRLQMTQDIHFPSPSSEDEDDEDEDGTALGVAAPVFTPQPNAFSHPPTQPHTTPRGSYFPLRYPRSTHPSHHAANEADLRASLTTLLSCARAARSLPKSSSPSIQVPGITRNEFQGLRLVPESELMGTAAPPSASPNCGPGLAARSPSARARSSATVSSQEDEKERAKRKAGAQGRAMKKKKMSVQDVQREQARQMLSPTLLTWLVSAGVVVFVSVVGFGAGYAMGYESGKQEGEILKGCGREMTVPRVKRFRWGGRSGITA